ncbi:MAG TPA: hypothetical protein VMT73_00875 [Anaerolineales bacterium]|nr:hypothetical protein [Anaerolineales bacterium]
MKQDRFLMGILIAIGLLVIVALSLFFARRDQRSYLNSNSPDAVVFNYVLAVTNKDYQKAYGYLADLDGKPTYEEFRKSFITGAINPNNVGVDVGEASINSDEATVSISLIYSPSDPFSSGSRSAEQALLIQQNNDWKISSMPYNLWDYNWYQTPVKP